MSLNCRSLRRKVAELKTCLDDQKIKIAMLQETWLSEGDSSIYAEIREMGFKILKCERKEKRGGGLAILIKSVKSKRVSASKVSKQEQFDFVLCTLVLENVKINIVNLYRPPHYSKKDFIDKFEDFLTEVLDLEGTVMIFGDFNINMLQPSSINMSLLSVLKANGLTQLINKTTRGNALLDFIIVETSQLHKMTLLDPIAFFPSDHSPLFLKLATGSDLPKEKSTKIYMREYDKIDMDDFYSELSARITRLAQPDYACQSTSSDLVWMYNEVVSKAIEHHCPEVKRVFRPDRTSRWYNKELQNLKQKKRRAERKLQKSKSEENWEQYKSARNIYTSALKQTRTEYYSHKIDCLKDNPRGMFKVLAELTGRKKECVVPTHKNENIVCEEIADFYIEKVTGIRDQILSTVATCSQNHPSNILTGSNMLVSLESFNQISISKLTKMISEMNNKSCSMDPMPTQLVKSCKDLLFPIILKIINLCFAESYFPDSLKTAIVTPILKDNSKDPDEYRNYRPVSSLPFLSKVVEKAIHEQLSEYIESNNLHAKYQSAYRQSHSCETAMLKVVDTIQENIGNGFYVLLILLDSSAAFDTVDHILLLKKLEERYAIRGNALKLIQSYLENRKFVTTIKNSSSTTRDLLYGVPQGSLLGPLFYVLYTKEIEEIVIQHGLNIHMYADDCQIFVNFRHGKVDETKRRVECCLRDIKLWMDRHYLKLNGDKTVIKMFQPATMPSVSLSINGVALSKTAKVLGVSMDDHTKFYSFINKKVQTCNYHLRNLRSIKKSLNFSTRVLLVTNLIMSTADYCNILLLPATSADLKPLRLVMNKAVRFIYDLRIRTHITPFYKKLHLLPIHIRIKFKACLLAYKCYYKLSPTYLHDEFETFKYVK